MLKLTLSLMLILSTVITQCSQKLEFDGLDYTLVRKNKVMKIAAHDVDPLLRQMTKTQLRDFQTRYKVSSKKLSDGSRVVRPNLKLNGGGPVSGWVAYWATKALFYTGMTIVPGGIGAVAAAEVTAAKVGVAVSVIPYLP